MNYYIIIERGITSAKVNDAPPVEIPDTVIHLKLDPLVDELRELVQNIIIYGFERGTYEWDHRDRCRARVRAFRAWLGQLPAAHRAACAAYLHHQVREIRRAVKRPDFSLC